MNYSKCENGHFYDADAHSSCPHCASCQLNEDQLDITVERSSTVENTTPINIQCLGNSVIYANGLSDEGEKTLGIYSNINGTEPVVGWLVCTKGEHYGEDFSLKAGRNFIGRSETMDIVLSRDRAVSREKHAIILFEPKESIFLVEAGDSRELFYVNGNVVANAKEIKAYDEICIGESAFRFIPFCNKEIHWIYGNR